MGFPPPTGGVWEVEDIESDAVDGAAILKVVYDDLPESESAKTTTAGHGGVPLYPSALRPRGVSFEVASALNQPDVPEPEPPGSGGEIVSEVAHEGVIGEAASTNCLER